MVAGVLASFRGAVGKNHHKQSGFKAIELYSHSSGGQDPEIKLSQDWYPLEALREKPSHASLQSCWWAPAILGL